MRYYSREIEIVPLILSLGLYFGIGRIVYKYYGWPGVFIILGSIFFICIVLSQFIKWRNIQREQKVNRLPCSHGVEGAIRDSSLCVRCTVDHQEKERIAKIKVFEEERIKNEKHVKAYSEWVKRIRLPEYLKKIHPEEFEKLICQLYTHLGYEVQHTKYTGDSGIDAFLRKDGHLTILQCKRVKGSVGQPVLRDLYGTMRAEDASSGLIVTTGKISKQAQEWVKDKPIEIIEL
jgi:restriction endonuclease Mrr